MIKTVAQAIQVQTNRFNSTDPLMYGFSKAVRVFAQKASGNPDIPEVTNYREFLDTLPHRWPGPRITMPGNKRLAKVALLKHFPDCDTIDEKWVYNNKEHDRVPSNVIAIVPADYAKARSYESVVAEIKATAEALKAKKATARALKTEKATAKTTAVKEAA